MGVFFLPPSTPSVKELIDASGEATSQRWVLKKMIPRQVVWVTGLGTLVALKILYKTFVFKY